MALNSGTSSQLKNLANKLTDLQSKIEGSVAKLNSYVETANTTRTKSVYTQNVNLFNSEKQNYDSLMSEYTALGGTYDETLELHNTLTTAMKAEIVNVEIPNFKNENNWLPGTTLYNAKNSGGILYSPTSIGAPDDKPENDEGFVFTKGNIPAYLNESHTELKADLKEFDINNLLNETQSQMIYEAKVTITLGSGETVTRTQTIMEHNIGSMSNMMSSVDSYQQAAVQSIQSVMSSPSVDFMSANFKQAAIAFAITSVMDGKEFSFDKTSIGNFIGSSLVSTVENMVSSQVTQAVAQTFGITNFTAMGILGFAVSSLVSEAMEVAMGLDNSFGFGGDLKGFDDQGRAQYAQAFGFQQGLIDTLQEIATFGFADTLTYNSIGANYSVETIASASFQNDFSNFADNPQDIGFNDRNAMRNLTDFNNYQDSLGFMNDFSGVDAGDIGGFSNRGIGNYSSRSDFGSVGSIGSGPSDTGGDGSGNHGTSSGVGGGGNKSGSTSGGGSYSCFLAGTKIKVYKGFEIINKNIEDVKIGELVIGFKNTINRVLQYDRPITLGRKVYSINDTEHFVTAEHMFLTPQGWKSISPKLTKRWERNLYYELGMNKFDSQLKVGDFIYKNMSGIQVLVRVDKIDSKKVANDTQLYNFKLNGDNTYCANGFIVHNK